MQIILMERVAKLGQMGEIVTVKAGYARNFLLPKGKAKRASQENISRFEKEKTQLEAHNLETRKEAEVLAEKLSEQKFIIIRAASDAGALYGSVTSRDIVGAINEGGFTIERRQVVLGRPIKELGLHDILIALHPEVEVAVSINVARSVEEAELQASGKSVQELAAEVEAEAAVEISELFDDIGAAVADDDELMEPLDNDEIAGARGAEEAEQGVPAEQSESDSEA